MATDLQSAVLRLVRARDARIAAKKEYCELAAEVGECLNKSSTDGPCYYAHRLRPVEPCEVCVMKIPAWNKRQAAAKEAGAALRVLVNTGRKIIPEEKESK